MNEEGERVMVDIPVFSLGGRELPEKQWPIGIGLVIGAVVSIALWTIIVLALRALLA